ncbi:MAG: hypothetical protein J7M38_14870 [Armatimonadetes bacterium]|nr:hypothetical protein [Armatimonadota bacterium]
MIRWAEDLGAPAVVTAVNVVTETQKPEWNRPVGIGLAALGYVLGGYMGIGGQFVKNLGIAAAPWAMKAIYEYIKEQTAVSARTARLEMRPSARLGTSTVVSPAYKPEEETVSIITP